MSFLGGLIDIYVPRVETMMGLGFTEIRVYWGSTEGGSYSNVGSVTLVAGQSAYSYNHTTGAPGEWAYYTLYGSTPGESATSEPVRVGSVHATRALVRQAAGRLLRIMQPVTTATSVASATQFVCSDFIDPDGLPQRLQNWWVRSAIQSRQLRRASSSPAGWVPSTGTFNVRRAFSPQLTQGDTIELWRPKDMDDPSRMMDEAMNSARRRVWWEEVFYLTTTSDVTEYALPAGIVEQEGQIKRVEYAARTFPDAPMWRPVSNAEVTFDGGVPVLSLGYSGWGLEFSAGSVVRVLLNRFGDRMDGENDYWSAPLEWCAAETALSFLSRLGVPSGTQEAVQDIQVSMAMVEEECKRWRALGPSVRMRIEPPR